jgi:ATP-binding cassette subfamily B protein
MLGLLLQLHPLAIIVLLLSSAPQAIIGGHYANRLYGLNTGQAAARRMALYWAELLSSRDAIKEVRLFGLERYFLDRFHRFFRQHFNAEKKIHFYKEWTSMCLALLSLAGTAGIWVYAIIQAVQSRITIGDVALVLQAAEQARVRLESLFYEAGELYENSLFTTNLFHFLDLAPDAMEGALSRSQDSSIPLICVAQPIQQGIEFRNVSFRYPGSDRYILKHFSCRLPARKTIALVGENGASKTTLVKLLVRFYDPTQGCILLDGKDLRDYDLDSLRQQMSIIFQDFVRFDLTAAENIGMGQIELADDLERVTRAAQMGGAQSIIDRLPKKFDNILGKRFDEGVDLSGGEWQKIALSRAFMRQA